MATMSNSHKDNADNSTEHLREKAAEVTQNIRDIGGHVRDAATDKFSEVRDQAGEYYRKGKETAQEFEQTLESYIKEKPLQSVAMAAGIGILLGLLWKRS